MRKRGQATRVGAAYGESVKPETRTFYEAAVMRAVERVGRSLDEALDLDALTLTTGGIPMDVTIETLPARRLATVRHFGPYPQIAEAFHRLGRIAAERGLYAHVDPPMLALYHDDPETTPPAELRSDAALV